MPDFELGERVKQEHFVDHASCFQPRALPDLNVRSCAPHDEFAATGGTGPVGLDLCLVAAQCMRRRDRLSQARRTQACAPICFRAYSPVSCARQTVGKDFVTR